MTSYQKVLQELKGNKQRRLSGDVIAIPWELPRLSTVLPGVEQKKYYLISSTPKAGKSQITDFLFVYQPIEWIIANQSSDISLKIFYFSLEVSSNAKLAAAMCYKLFKDYKILIGPQKLNSVFGNYIMDDEVEQAIESDKFHSWFIRFENIITYYDSIRNPYGIYNVIRSYAEDPKNGHYIYKDVLWKNEKGEYEKKQVIDSYIPRRPNEFVIIIVDHLSLLQPEHGQTLHQAISQFSSDYCLRMRDRWGYTPVLVQQQSADSSRAQFNYRGDTIIDKIRPDPEGLADMKYTSRDCDLMLSLFNPCRYNIKEHEGIDIERLGDTHRELMINLNRWGVSNATIQLLFLGQSSYFAELPKTIREDDYLKVEAIVSKNR